MEVSKGVQEGRPVWHGGGMSGREKLLYAIARDQRGVFTLAQAEACGLPRRTVAGRAAQGLYDVIHPGVYGLAGSDDTWTRAVVGAILSASEPAAASHETAARLWGMADRKPRIIEVVSRRHLRVKRDGFTVHESKDLVNHDIVQLDGVPITTAARTVVDLGASAPLWLVAKCLDTGLRKRLFTIWDVHRFMCRVARPGRTGVGTIRPLVEERLTWEGITESDLEDLFRKIVASSSYPLPETQHRLFDASGVFVGRFDFAYPTRMAIVETDSEGFHMDPVSFQRDREKQNRAHALGWTVYRVTWRQLIDDPDSVRAIIAAIWED